MATFVGIGAVSAAILMTELALTRIFSVTMYFHFAFLAISIALFGLSASAVLVYVMRGRFASIPTSQLLTRAALLHAVGTIVALGLLVRIRVGLNYSPGNLLLMLVTYLLAALPFLTGGAVIAFAFTRLASRINVAYAADLLGAALGCLALLPLLNALGAPGVVLAAAGLAFGAAVCFSPRGRRMRMAVALGALFSLPAAAQVAGAAPFEVADTKGHEGDRVLFSKWNSFSRIAVYEREHGDWSLSPMYSGPRGEALFMDIDSAASTPILKGGRTTHGAEYLRYELTALAYHLVERRGGFTALVIGPGGGRDLVSALVFGARHVDGVEINPIIARDVMLDRFFDYSGGIYADPRVTIHVDDGRSFVRRTASRYDVIQASLVDTWAATAAGAYTLTENSLYTTEAFGEYLDHLTDDGMLTITRWVFDGLRLVSLAQAVCDARGLDAADHLAVVQLGRIATFLLKKQPFTPADTARLQATAERLGFTVLYAPGMRLEAPSDYARLILAPDRAAFIERYPLDISPTTDDRPFFFHTTRLGDQFGVAFGRSMLFGNGLSALLTLMGISAVLVALFVIGPLLVGGERLAPGWGRWLFYFGALGAGFMLLEVALLQRFVLLLGHPVYSLTVTLFSLLLGTGVGSLVSRRVAADAVRPAARRALVVIIVLAAASAAGLAAIVDLMIAWPLPLRVAATAALLFPIGVILGIPLPAGMRLLATARPTLIAWGWGMNGALSVVGATLAVFLAMNWGFSAALSMAGVVYGTALLAITRTSN